MFFQDIVTFHCGPKDVVLFLSPRYFVIYHSMFMCLKDSPVRWSYLLTRLLRPRLHYDPKANRSRASLVSAAP